MRCYICGVWSWVIICKLCKKMFLPIRIHKRRIDSFDVFSFYDYRSIEPLLLTKHSPEGYRLYKALAEMTMKPFAEAFIRLNVGKVYIIAVNESVKHGYGHTAILSHAMKTIDTIPLHASLMANNDITYAGKKLAYRLAYPRDFVYRGKKNIDAILVDDIVTTGLTLKEAHKVLCVHGVNVLFTLTLADAKSSR
jgi:competence protein ComFC